jgi:hypothetical protein
MLIAVNLQLLVVAAMRHEIAAERGSGCLLFDGSDKRAPLCHGDSRAWRPSSKKQEDAQLLTLVALASTDTRQNGNMFQNLLRHNRQDTSSIFYLTGMIQIVAFPRDPLISFTLSWVLLLSCPPWSHTHGISICVTSPGTLVARATTQRTLLTYLHRSLGTNPLAHRFIHSLQESLLNGASTTGCLQGACPQSEPLLRTCARQQGILLKKHASSSHLLKVSAQGGLHLQKLLVAVRASHAAHGHQLLRRGRMDPHRAVHLCLCDTHLHSHTKTLQLLVMNRAAGTPTCGDASTLLLPACVDSCNLLGTFESRAAMHCQAHER